MHIVAAVSHQMVDGLFCLLISLIGKCQNALRATEPFVWGLSIESAAFFLGGFAVFCGCSTGGTVGVGVAVALAGTGAFLEGLEAGCFVGCDFAGASRAKWKQSGQTAPSLSGNTMKHNTPHTLTCEHVNPT